MTILRRLAAAALLLAAPAGAYDYPRPKNWRKAKRPPKAAKAAPEPESLKPLGPGWSPKARAALAELLAVRGSSAAAYNEQLPPVAAIGYDRLAVDGDAAEAVFHKLVTEAEFKFGDDFWKRVPIGFGRQRLRAHYETFSARPKRLWPTQPEYLHFRKDFLDSYQRICALVGVKECRSYLASLLIGFGEEEARDYVKRALDEESRQAPRDELVANAADDAKPLRWRRGFRVRPEVSGLVATLRAAGFDVWAVGLDAVPVLVTVAAMSGIDPTRCLGIAQGLERQRLDGRLREPIPIRVGAIDALQGSIGRRPAFAIASWAPFADLVLYADGLRVAVEQGDAELEKRLAGAAVRQPAFDKPRR